MELNKILNKEFTLVTGVPTTLSHYRRSLEIQKYLTDNGAAFDIQTQIPSLLKSSKTITAFPVLVRGSEVVANADQLLDAIECNRLLPSDDEPSNIQMSGFHRYTGDAYDMFLVQVHIMRQRCLTDFLPSTPAIMTGMWKSKSNSLSIGDNINFKRSIDSLGSLQNIFVVNSIMPYVRIRKPRILMLTGRWINRCDTDGNIVAGFEVPVNAKLSFEGESTVTFIDVNGNSHIYEFLDFNECLRFAKEMPK